MPLSPEVRRKIAALGRASREQPGDEAPPDERSDAVSDAPRAADIPEPPCDGGLPFGAVPLRERSDPSEDCPPSAVPPPGELPPTLRARLRARLQHRHPAAGPVSVPDTDVVVGRVSRPDTSLPPLAVEALLPGREHAVSVGACYLMEGDLEALGAGAASLAAGLRQAALELPPEGEAVFLDIETAGLSGMPVFLVGLLRLSARQLTLVQYLARDYPEEAAVLHAAVSGLREASVLFTYNGASFDLPYLADRSIYHSVEFRLECAHTDLLPLARRRFRGALPDCKLQTLERHLCRRNRTDDIPGAEIPQRYHDFVRSRDARLLEPIIHHNRLDLLTLAEILPHCLT